MKTPYEKIRDVLEAIDQATILTNSPEATLYVNDIGLRDEDVYLILQGLQKISVLEINEWNPTDVTTIGKEGPTWFSVTVDQNKFKEHLVKISDLIKVEAKTIKQLNKNIISCGCGSFKLDTNNGDVFVNDKFVARFIPDKYEFILIKKLLEADGGRLTYDEISKILYPKKSFVSDEDKKNIRKKVELIKKKLYMSGEKPKNQNVFEICNGYRLICLK